MLVRTPLDARIFHSMLAECLETVFEISQANLGRKETRESYLIALDSVYAKDLIPNYASRFPFLSYLLLCN